MTSEPTYLLDISEQDYHADTIAKVPTLSNSIGKVLVTKSPAHAYLEHPRLGGQPRKPSTEMDKGSIIHELVLGEGPGIEIMDHDAWRTKESKELRQAAWDAGKTPVLKHKFAALQIAAKRIKERIAGLGYQMNTGLTEQAIVWEEFGKEGSCLCRCRMDKVWPDEGQIIDLKTTENAHPSACDKHMVNFSYSQQAAAYTSALTALKPELAGRIGMTFLFCEIEPPYAVTPVICGGSMAEYGERNWQKAVDLWSTCLSTQTWPTYTDKVHVAQAPTWALAQQEMEEGDE